jgi:hypothetical protein
VACLFNIQDSLDPGHHLMGAGIGRLIQIDDTIFKVILERSFERSGPGRNGGVVVGEYIHLVIVFQEEGPIFGLDGGWLIRRLNDELIVDHFLFCHDLFFLQLLLLILRHRLLIDINNII